MKLNTAILLIATAFATSPGPLLAQTPAADSALTDKTLVVWVAPANLTQRGGSALTIEDQGDRFDAIVFGELDGAKWMAGSEMFSRTQKIRPVFRGRRQRQKRSFRSRSFTADGGLRPIATGNNTQSIPSPPSLSTLGRGASSLLESVIGDKATTRISPE